jgi:UrcA family protein
LNKITTTTLCAIAAAIATLSPLYCQASDVAGSAKVSYSDLNLSNSDDVHTLYRRLSKAADLVCPEDSLKVHQGCVREAMGESIRRANVAALSTLYTKITGVRIDPMFNGTTVVAKAR